MDQATDNPGAGETVAESELDRIRQAAGLNSRQHWCELSPDAMICLDGRWRVLFFNRAADELFQASGMLAVGQPPWQCAPLLGILEELSLDSLSAEPRVQRCMVRQVELGKAGTRALEAAVAVAGAHDERVFTICIRDVSQKAPAQPTLYQSQRRQLVGSLAGGIAHDFNNILTAVICQIDLALLDKELSQQARESLMQAMESARRGAELNAKLLQFSRNTEARPTAVQLTRLVDETVFLLRRGIDRRIGIQFAAPGSDLWPAWVDEGQFMQVLMSLSLNARDAMPKGGELAISLSVVELDSTAAQWRSTEAQAGEFVCLSVSDTGCGIAPEDLLRIYEPFFTTKAIGQGTGLGLSTVYGIVKQHGGWIEVSSKLNIGTKFNIFLPSVVAGVAAATGGIESKVVGGTETILLVEDEPPVRTLAHVILQRNGYHVLEATSGADALSVWGQHAAKIDLLLTDIIMPQGVSGRELAQKLRAERPGLKVVFVSGYSPDSMEIEAELNEQTLFMQKPYLPEHLLRSVRQVLDGQAKQPDSKQD